MGFAPEYHGYRFMQDPAPNGGKGKDLELYGTVTWTVDIARVYAFGHAGLVSNWNARGYKIGLLLLEGQTIESFVYGGASLQSIPEATTDLVLESSQLALQIHESVGHALELDRILLPLYPVPDGREASGLVHPATVHVQRATAARAGRRSASRSRPW